MIPKIISLYLPQFHEVKENSKWYGEGYTDWVAAQKAVPLFDGHIQPRKPLNNNYYDLSNIEVIKWQAALAKEYGIDGFCFYHYWFDSYHRLLEKPAELLLKNKEIDISFCFSWVNESWKRTWSNVQKGNAWCVTCDCERPSGDMKDRGLLVKQRYGREEEWKKHIEYLIPFFKDERYLRVDGKPVLYIYRPCDIFCIKAMLEVWNSRLKDENIDGIYLIGASYEELYSGDVNINYEHEPSMAIMRCERNGEYEKSKEGLELFDYDILWKSILDRIECGKISCAFTDFDASPRKGYKGWVVKGSTPEKFEQYFKEFLSRNMQIGSELVLVNAWNEWGEGMYLEPCETNGYGYLRAVKSAIQYVQNKPQSMWKNRIDNKRVNAKISTAALQISVLNQWLSTYRLGIRVTDFFYQYGYSTIAIYGMGILGKQLKEELLESDLKILYYIDQREIPEETLLKRVTIEEELPQVDCIVVTALAEYEKIYNVLKTKSNAAIVHLNEIFEDLF